MSTQRAFTRSLGHPLNSMQAGSRLIVPRNLKAS